jgi:hypothetical protein
VTATLSLVAFFGLLGVNIAYGLRAIIRDKTEGRFALAAVGAVCLVGMNLLIGWLIYEGIMNSTDF